LEDTKSQSVQRATKWNKEHPKRRSEIGQKHYRKNKKEQLDYQRNFYIKLKKEVLSYYSNRDSPKCLWCGEDRIACLSIDHIFGHGNEERRRLGLAGVTFYRWLKGHDYPEGYQTLCMNCQFIKRQGDVGERSGYTE
jgi:hypothetical protein